MCSFKKFLRGIILLLLLALYLESPSNAYAGGVAPPPKNRGESRLYPAYDEPICGFWTLFADEFWGSNLCPYI